MKLGRLAPYPPQTKPRLMLGQFLTGTYPTAPPVVDYISKVDNWPVYLNDRIGDCTCAAAGHMVEAWTRYGQGATVAVTDQDVLAAYEAVSGYDPASGANDNGAVMQDVLDYWRKTGVGGHRIAAFFQVDLTNAAELDAALYLFGHVYLGINCPQSALDQFNAGQPWDAVANDGGIAGGHAIDWGFVAAGQNHKVVTWGAVQEMTPAFLARYAEEAWAVADEEWIAKNQSPAGLDTAALNAAFQAMTGQPGPFPVTPTPVPVPPSPPGDADHALAAVAHPWVRERHTHLGGNEHMAEALKHWMAARGL